MLYAFSSVFPFTVCLLWTVMFLLEWREANPAKHVLAVFMGVCSVLYFCHALFFNDEGGVLTVADCVYSFCNIAVFPLYLIYILRLTSNRSLSWRHGLLMMPAAVVCALRSLSLFYPPHFVFFATEVAKWVFLLQLLPVCLVGCRRLRDFDLKVENFYSSTEQRVVTPTRYMVIILCACSCVSAVSSIVGREHFLDNSGLLFVPSFFFGSLLFAVGFVGQKQAFCADDLCAPDVDDTADEAEAPGKPSRTMQALEALMQSERLYLQPDLRLSDVALRLGVSRSTLSAAINQSAGMSFSDYVSGFRVGHAQDIMRNDPQSASLSVIQIAEQSGFVSESSFYRAFRKITGQTPKQWLSMQ